MATINKVGEISSQLDPMVPHIYRVRKNSKETHDIFTLELEPTFGVEPLIFALGQFNMLYDFGMGQSAISIRGDANTNKKIIYVYIRIRKDSTMDMDMSQNNKYSI